MKFSLPLSVVATALLTAACGTPEAGTSAKLAAASDAGVKTQILDAGEYLVTFAGPAACVTGELNLKKQLKMNIRADEMPEMIFAGAGLVSDNLMHTKICRQNPPLSEGTAVVKLTGKTKIIAADNLAILRVRKVTSKLVVDADATLMAGTYIAELEGTGGCYNQEVNVKKALAFNDGQATIANLQSAGGVPDDLMRAAVCMPNSQMSAAVAVEAKGKTVVKGVGPLHVKSLAKVTSSRSLFLQ